MLDVMVLQILVMVLVEVIASDLLDHLAGYVVLPDLVVDTLVSFFALEAGLGGECVQALEAQLRENLDVFLLHLVVVTHDYEFLVEVDKVTYVTLDLVLVDQSIRIEVDGNKLHAIDDALSHAVELQTTVSWQG